MRIVSGKQMREIDRTAIEEFKIPGLELMESAGTALTDCIIGELNQRKNQNDCMSHVLILCGSGNNGGDGYVAARKLMDAGISVKVFSVVKTSTLLGDAKTNYFEFVNRGISVEEILKREQINELTTALYQADIVVDAILGTGITREVEGVTKEIIEAVNACAAYVISVDIPSGIGADDGKVYGAAIGASKTITFQLPKIGCVIYPGREYCGELVVGDIGISLEMIEKVLHERSDFFYQMERDDIGKLIKKRPQSFHKGNAGRVLIIAGSKGMAGAAILSTRGALRAGAGLVSVAVPDELNDIIQGAVPEAICLILDKHGKTSNEKHANHLINYDALAAGPGMGNDQWTKESIERLLQNIEKPMIIDADGINVLNNNLNVLKESKAKVILTPHVGEFARLLGCTAKEVNENRIALAKTFAKEYNVILVLKGESSLICSPEGKVFLNKTGNPGMATGGSGDVLAGVLAAFAGQFGFSPEMVAAGVYIHGRAGDIMSQSVGEIGLIASDIAMGVAHAIAEVHMEWQNL